MAEMNHLTTNALVKSYLGKEEGGEDAFVDMLIEGVTQRMESYCGRTFRSVQRTEHHTPSGASPDLVLDQGPINQLVSVSRGGGSVALTDLRFEDRTLTLLSGGFPVAWYGGIEVSVDYWAGFHPNVPGDLTLAATIQSAFEYEQSAQGSDRLGLTSKTPGGGDSNSFIIHDWVPAVLSTLDGYRRSN